MPVLLQQGSNKISVVPDKFLPPDTHPNHEDPMWIDLVKQENAIEDVAGVPTEAHRLKGFTLSHLDN